MSDGTEFKVGDRVCTEHGSCGRIEYIYEDDYDQIDFQESELSEPYYGQRALIAFDDPGSGPDTWYLAKLLPE